MALGARAFVGRRSELGELGRWVEETREGRGGVVVVWGEAGVGKTRLCAELSALADGLGFGTAWATCWESTRLPSYWPWRQLLGQAGVEFASTTDPDVEPDVARAQLLSAIVARLRGVASDQPRLFVLDDVQWADAATLSLLAHVGPLLRSIPVLVLVAARVGDRVPSLPVEVLRGARTVSVGGLSVDQVAELITSLTGSEPSSGVVEALHDITEGNPLFVVELVQHLERTGAGDLSVVLEEFSLPPTVRAVLGERLGGLSGDCQELLEIAAVFGRQIPASVLAEVGERTVEKVRDAVDEAVAAGAVRLDRVECYVFTHPLLGRVMLDQIGATKRVRLHQRIAETLEMQVRRGHHVDLATLSFHYFSAGPEADRDSAIRYSQAAAEAAMEALGYEDAVVLYDRALSIQDMVPDQPGRGRLLLGAGMARAAIGDVEGARAAFLGAADQARKTDDIPTLASAALGLASGGFEVALFDNQQLALLEEAHVALSDDEPALRSRVCSRLSVALSLSGHDQQRRSLCADAVRLAKEAKDSAALGHALAARCDTQAGPVETGERLSDAAEIVRLGLERNDPGTELLGRRLKLVAALGLGDMRIVDAEIYAFDHTEQQLLQPRYGWYVPLWRAVRAVMGGDLDQQAVLTAEAEDLARAAGSPNSDILITTQWWLSQIEAGDYDTAVDQLERSLPAGSYDDLGVRMLPYWGKHRLLAGRPDEAHAMLDRAADEIRDLEQDSEWLTTLAQIADICADLGGHQLVGWLYEALLPHATLWAVEGIGAYTHGSVQRHLGRLATLLDKPDEARAHFEAAVSSNRQAGADLLVARTLLERGTALDERHALEASSELYHSLGVTRRAAQIEKRLEDTSPERGQPQHRPAAITTQAASLLHEGATWSIQFAGRRCTVRDTKGLRDIARLVAEPGREVAALELANPESTRLPTTGLGDAIDPQARAAYKARLVELETELDEADRAADIERSARAQAEIDTILDHLTGAFGLGGRPRQSGHPAERARTAVTARIRYAIQRIREVHPDLGRHLENSIRTGTFCSYTPDPPISWQL